MDGYAAQSLREHAPYCASHVADSSGPGTSVSALPGSRVHRPRSHSQGCVAGAGGWIGDVIGAANMSVKHGLTAWRTVCVSPDMTQGPSLGKRAPHWRANSSPSGTLRPPIFWLSLQESTSPGLPLTASVAETVVHVSLCCHVVTRRWKEMASRGYLGYDLWSMPVGESNQRSYLFAKNRNRRLPQQA